ncbi:MAG TPA: hypothetical protein VEB64_16970 [Azospirillaceae bacterium]|nr:hypothetical protein [Azospirillaceae bacterium]
MPDQSPRKIALFAYPNVMCLDVAGPLQVFANANAALAEEGLPPAYAPEVIAPEAGFVATSCGLTLVAGGRGAEALSADAEVVAATLH